MGKLLATTLKWFGLKRFTSDVHLLDIMTTITVIHSLPVNLINNFTFAITVLEAILRINPSTKWIIHLLPIAKIKFRF
jgi:hypothetical protein